MPVIHIHITRFVKPPIFNKNTMQVLCYNDESVAVSKASKTSVHFVKKGTKVDASYYRETLLQRCLLPEILQKSDDHCVFQQDGALSHRAKSTIEFLQCTMPNFIELSVWPPNSPDLNPVDYAVWGLCSRAFITFRFPIWTISRTECATAGRILTNSSSPSLLISGVTNCRLYRLKAVVRVNGGHIEQLF